MAVQYAPTKLRVPPGFQNILEGFAREVLREQPQDIIQFGAQYFKAQLSIRDDTGKDDAKRGENLEKLQKGEEVDIDLNDPEVQAAATKIQASFRGHKTREDVKHKKEEEAAALKIQSSFRGHQAREQVKEIKESRSKESVEASPTKEPEKPTEDEVDIDLNDPEVQGAALKIQASFRGHKARSEVQKIKSSEVVADEAKDEVEKEKEGEVSEAAVTEQPSESAPKEEEIDIDLNDPQVEKAATVIQSTFRAHKSRESVKAMVENESAEEPKEDTVDQVEETTVVADQGDASAADADKGEEIDIDLSDPEVNKAAMKIQASFRGHKTRQELKDKSPTASEESVKVEAADDVAPETASEQQPAEAESEPQEAVETQDAPAETDDKADDAAPESAEAAPETESEPQAETAVEGQEAEPTPEAQESTPQADDTDKPETTPEDTQPPEDQAES